MLIALWIFLGLLVLVAIYDLTQKRHAIRGTSRSSGHFRYLFEMVGPGLRQYIVTNNDEERPFSRDQRRWIYASAKKQNRLFGFGADNDLEQSANYLIIKHAAFPVETPHEAGPATTLLHRIPCAKVLGRPWSSQGVPSPRSSASRA
ncbi:MAG: hypothetical protein R3F20_15425 [Planctomycetota bacterium]